MNTESTTEINKIAEFVERFINQTNQSVFLTGKAGTGKTTLLKKITESTYKQYVIVAPTGIAALNAGGVTIHSFFQLPFGGFIPDFNVAHQFTENGKMESKSSLNRHFKMNKSRINMIRNLELLIIDEVSMLRADLLDAMDWSLRNVRKINEPFGGIQVLFIGDLLQLPPVVKNEEWNILKQYYRGMYFFHAKVIQENPLVYLELNKIYRQSDDVFINILNHLRENKFTKEDLEKLNKHVDPKFEAQKEQGYITLTTHNFKADEINTKALLSLKNPSFYYKAEIIDEFPKNIFPIEETLELKVGAQIIFVKNDVSYEKNFYNGKMGIIKSLSKNEIYVEFPEEKKIIEVEKYEWENVRYKIDESNGEIIEETLGTFLQYPIKLAWAITVHKSQGLTFDKAVLDVSQSFAPGQVYVALSRLRSLEGLVLTSPLQVLGLNSDVDVVQYTSQEFDEIKLKSHIDIATKNYIYHYLISVFEWQDLIDKWMMHEVSYKNVPSKSIKGAERAWVTNQVATIFGTRDAAKKFQNQIHQLIFGPNFDLNLLNERIQAAYIYFFKILDGLVYSTLKKIDEIHKKPKTKQYVEELLEIDEIQIDTILKLKRGRLFIESYLNKGMIQKSDLWNDETKNYKFSKLELIKAEKRGTSLLEENEEVSIIPLLKKEKSTEKKEKVEKVNTYEVTLNLLKQEGKSIEEIARIRQLSLNTIYTHLARLIQSEQIELSDVMAVERIRELENYFEDYNELSLTPLKEKLGDLVTWEELKLYRASTLI